MSHFTATEASNELLENVILYILFIQTKKIAIY